LPNQEATEGVKSTNAEHGWRKEGFSVGERLNEKNTKQLLETC